jgi:2'-5' RNA ligase
MSDKRLFIALSLPESVRAALHDYQHQLRHHLPATIRWTKPEQVHLTLLFIGMTPVEQIERIKEKVHQVSERFTAFRLELGEPGAFPSLKHPSILWLGVGGNLDVLHHLQNLLAFHLSDWYQPERAYHPHLTLARARQAGLGSAVNSAFLTARLEQKPVWKVEGLSLFASTLKASGAEYQALLTINFKPPPRTAL